MKDVAEVGQALVVSPPPASLIANSRLRFLTFCLKNRPLKRRHIRPEFGPYALY
ncbi:hypothetical protein KDN24_23005 [Bacillus sp. Bva_UNVM-123]|uniref:hypothetical protein n=1 Tax=Bacillus sp. Bva_UNVM-123 TaxID=2829798 RepID=UPI00391EF668